MDIDPQFFYSGPVRRAGGRRGGTGTGRLSNLGGNGGKVVRKGATKGGVIVIVSDSDNDTVSANDNAPYGRARTGERETNFFFRLRGANPAGRDGSLPREGRGGGWETFHGKFIDFFGESW